MPTIKFIDRNEFDADKLDGQVDWIEQFNNAASELNFNNINSIERNGETDEFREGNPTIHQLHGVARYKEIDRDRSIDSMKSIKCVIDCKMIFSE